MLRDATGPPPGRTLVLRGLLAMTDLRSSEEARRRVPWRNGAMVALGVLTCVIWALVTAVSMLLATLDYGTEGETPWALLAVWVLVVFAPAAWFGLRRRGAWGWWAAGFPTAFALVLTGTLIVDSSLKDITRFKKLAAAAGLPEIDLHDVRRAHTLVQLRCEDHRPAIAGTATSATAPARP